jgi:hypothetical protein
MPSLRVCARPLVEQGLGEWADGDGVSHGD